MAETVAEKIRKGEREKRYADRDRDVDGVAEEHGRHIPEQDIPHCAAAHGSDRAEHGNAEQVEFFFERDHHARKRKRRRADQFEYEDRSFHSFAP